MGIVWGNKRAPRDFCFKVFEGETRSWKSARMMTSTWWMPIAGPLSLWFFPRFFSRLHILEQQWKHHPLGCRAKWLIHLDKFPKQKCGKSRKSRTNKSNFSVDSSQSVVDASHVCDCWVFPGFPRFSPLFHYS